MNNKNRLYATLLVFVCFNLFSVYGQKVSLSLIPPTTITNQVNLDIRAGIVNNETEKVPMDIFIYLNKKKESALLHHSQITLAPEESHLVKKIISTKDKVGKNKIILVVKAGKKKFETIREIEILDSPTRSTQTIDGTWAGFYHWSETEGRFWNPDFKEMTDDNWRELVRSMHKLDMNVIVMTETFRNQKYVGQHHETVETYGGKAFYDSDLYPARFPIKANNPIEAVLSEADKLGMHVLVGVGIFAWFDFTEESLKWHKKVVDELFKKYGHHPSFYGFYVSEESHGALDNWEKDPEMKLARRKEIIHFFDEFKKHCSRFAPDKPIMLATNSSEVPLAVEAYPKLLKNLDIICPFGFARLNDQPGELGGKETADLLQKLCDDAGSHLWLDLEVFNFDEKGALYPKTIEDIEKDLLAFSNFEKILCYQLPGIFNDPSMSFRIGQESTLKRFREYLEYLRKVKKQR